MLMLLVLTLPHKLLTVRIQHVAYALSWTYLHVRNPNRVNLLIIPNHVMMSAHIRRTGVLWPIVRLSNNRVSRPSDLTARSYSR